MKVLRRKRNRGQTTLEYALVVGVIAVGVILAAKVIFGTKDSPAQDLMKKAVINAAGQIDGGSGD